MTIRGLNPGTGNRLFSSSKRPDPPWGAKRPGRDVDHSPSSSSEVKNELSYTSASSVRHGRGHIDLLRVRKGCATRRKVAVSIPVSVIAIFH